MWATELQRSCVDGMGQFGAVFLFWWRRLLTNSLRQRSVSCLVILLLAHMYRGHWTWVGFHQSSLLRSAVVSNDEIGLFPTRNIVQRNLVLTSWQQHLLSHWHAFAIIFFFQIWFLVSRTWWIHHHWQVDTAELGAVLRFYLWLWVSLSFEDPLVVFFRHQVILLLRQCKFQHTVFWLRRFWGALSHRNLQLRL